MPNRFDGKVVWITGASSGIGEALAHSFARARARLILSARSVEKLHEVAAAMPTGDVRVLPLDLSINDALPAKADEARSLFGRVDILVNNGGVSQRSFAMDTPLETTRYLMEVNFFGAVTLTHRLLPAMQEQGGGHVVVISSVMGKFGARRRSSYAASKHALHGYFDALRAEVWQGGIRVTLVCPGYVRTNISCNAFEAGGKPHGRMDPGQDKGMTPAACAAKILTAVARGRDEITIGGRETWGVVAKRFLPGLLNRMLRTIDPD